jgi:hypothetical protein
MLVTVQFPDAVGGVALAALQCGLDMDDQSKTCAMPAWHFLRLLSHLVTSERTRSGRTHRAMTFADLQAFLHCKAPTDELRALLISQAPQDVFSQ